jgi:putative ABC transport system ATP-binding protein
MFIGCADRPPGETAVPETATPKQVMSSVVARADAIGKTYPDGRGFRVVLDAVSIEAHAGLIVGIQGPSGCGKTTLIEIIAGLLRPDSGSVTLDGEPLDFSQPRAIARTRRDNVGLISQNYALLADESVTENVALPLRFGRPRPGRRERQDLVAQALHDAALDINPKRKVRSLSGGERQRVAIARALVRNPSLLIADEPTAALDAATGAAIIDRLRALADRGTSLLVATHDPAVAHACDTVHRFNGPHLHKIPSGEAIPQQPTVPGAVEAT